MMLTGKNLRRVFVATHGAGWAVATAKSLGVSLRTIRAWVAGSSRPPRDIREKIAAMIKARIAELEHVLDDVAGR